MLGLSTCIKYLIAFDWILREHQLITILSHFCYHLHLKINDKIYVYIRNVLLLVHLFLETLLIAFVVFFNLCFFNV
jgi:hypothetical protein